MGRNRSGPRTLAQWAIRAETAEELRLVTACTPQPDRAFRRHRKPQIPHLIQAHRVWRFEHNVEAALTLRKGDDLTNVLLVREEHQIAVDSHGDAAMWRRPVFKRFE